MGLDMRRVAAAALEAAFEGEAPEERPQSGHSAVRAIAAGLAIAGAARIALARASTLRELRGGLKVSNALRKAPNRIRETVADRFADVRDRAGGFEFGGTDSSDEGSEAELEPEEELEGAEDSGEQELEGAEDSGERQGGAEAEEQEEPEGEGPQPADAEESAESQAEEPDEASTEEPEEPEDAGAEESEATGEAQSEEPEAAGQDEDARDDGSRSGATSGGAEVLEALAGEDLEQPANRRRGRAETPDVLSLLSAHREPPPVLSRLGRTRESPASRPPVPPESSSRRRSRSRQGEKAGKS